MYIHYQHLESKGVRAAFLCQPHPGIDVAIKTAFGMQHVQPTRDVKSINPYRAYCFIMDSDTNIIDSDTKLYAQPSTHLQNTAYSAQIEKDKITIGILSQIGSIPPKGVEQIIESVVRQKFIPAGLIPTESTRDQIPASFLRPGI